MSQKSSLSAQHSKKPAISKQEREMALRIVYRCLAEKKYDISNIGRPFVRASIYTGLSISRLQAIQREIRSDSFEITNSSRTRSRKIGPLNEGANLYDINVDDLNVDDFDRHIVHRCIEEYVLLRPNFENASNLLNILKQKFTFPWDVAGMIKLIKAMGYVTLQAGSKKRHYGLERRDCALARRTYLENIIAFRQTGKNIIYIDETWVDVKHRFKKYWRIQAEDDIIKDVNAKDRLILVHAASKNGFLDKAKWIFEVGVTQGDLQVQMGRENFELWVNELLLPNLPEKSVVIMDSAIYHNELLPIPTRDSTKEELVAWANTELKDIITYKDDIDKETLYSLIELYFPTNYKRSYKIDWLIKQRGHEVLRIPPFMNTEFNPMLLAWEHISGMISEEISQTPIQVTTKILKQFTEKAISQLTAEDWREFDSKVRDMENIYWLRDKKTEEVVGKILGTDFIEEPSSDSD